MADENDEWVAKGYIKLQRNTFLERLLESSILFVLIGAIFLWTHSQGYHWKGRYKPAKPELKMYAPWAFGVAGVLLALRFLTDNYYLIDPERRRILYHFKFLGFRRVTPRLSFPDILAVAVTGRDQLRHHSIKRAAQYRLVALDYYGKQIALSDWQPEMMLESLNGQAESFATMLHCSSERCPPMHRLVVRPENGLPRVQFTRLPFWRSQPAVVLYSLIAIFCVMWLIAHFAGRSS